MKVKVRDSIIPARNVNVSVIGEQDMIYVTLNDIHSAAIGLTIQMSFDEAAKLTMDIEALLEDGKDVN